MANQMTVTDAFIEWFRSQGATVDTDAMGLADIPGYGRGVVALKDLPEGHTLFTIPRDLVLSMRTSSLPTKFGLEAWEQFRLHTGWTGLILCMLWEEAQGEASRWHGFFPILPTKFDTPMFWGDSELEELKGTAVVDKIGKDDAEKDFNEKLAPAVKSRPDIFPPKTADEIYSLEHYHLMGSRILSRSFHVLKWKGQDEDGEEPIDQEVAIEASANIDAMDVDGDAGETANTVADVAEELEADDEDSDDEDDRYEDPFDVAMVPMADMLNGRFATETARLFYEDKHVLKMMTVQDIEAGDQIWNTYGDPPNSDLLRRYGFVDVTTHRPPLSGEGNPADIVEITADLVVEAAKKHKAQNSQERVDWWLEEAEDDVFVIGTDCELPTEFISFSRLLLMSKADWEKTKSKGKLPKPNADADILRLAVDVLERRVKDYVGSTAEDEQLLASATDLGFNKRNAVIVRLGEKRILDGTIKELKSILASMKSDKKDGGKRKRAQAEPSSTKKSRR